MSRGNVQLQGQHSHHWYHLCPSAWALSTDTPSNQGQPLPQPCIVWIACSWIHLSSFPGLCYRPWKQRMDVANYCIVVFLQRFPVHLPLTYILAAQPSDTSQIICIKQTQGCIAVSRWAPSKSQDLWLHPNHQCHGQAQTHPQLDSFNCSEKRRKY